MWQAHPQKKRPKTSVPASATAKKRNPQFRNPCSSVYIDSEGSTGDRVRRAMRKCVMWAAIRAWTPIRTPARHLLVLDFRTTESGPLPMTGSEGSRASTATSHRPRFLVGLLAGMLAERLAELLAELLA